MTKITTDAQALAVLEDCERVLQSARIVTELVSVRAYLSARLASTSPAPDGWVFVRSDVVEFLRGSGELDGKWFGEPGPIENGYRLSYWWRKYLNSPAAPQPVVEKDNG